MKVLGRKVDSILAAGAGMVVTGCPACRLQIEHGLRERGKMMPVLHPVELLSRAYAGDWLPGDQGVMTGSQVIMSTPLRLRGR